MIKHSAKEVLAAAYPQSVRAVFPGGETVTLGGLTPEGAAEREATLRRAGALVVLVGYMEPTRDLPL